MFDSILNTSLSLFFSRRKKNYSSSQNTKKLLEIWKKQKKNVRLLKLLYRKPDKELQLDALELQHVGLDHNCSVKKVVFKNFANFTEKQLCWVTFLKFFKNTYFEERIQTTAFKYHFSLTFYKSSYALFFLKWKLHLSWHNMLT